MSLPAFTLNAGSADGRDMCVLKIQTSGCELNVWMLPDELSLLSSIRNATWSNRRSVAIGACAGSRAHWSCEDGRLNILIGDDDETWDLGVWIPDNAIDDMLKEILIEAPGIFPYLSLKNEGE